MRMELIQPDYNPTPRYLEIRKNFYFTSPVLLRRYKKHKNCERIQWPVRHLTDEKGADSVSSCQPSSLTATPEYSSRCSKVSSGLFSPCACEDLV